MQRGFVGRPDDGRTVWLHASKSTAAGARVRDARWGDFLNIVAQDDDGWTEIKWGSARYYIRTSEIVDTRPLEVIFLDVGQGDGCLVVSPDAGDAERILLVDAGQFGNMMSFVKWRFGKLQRKFTFHAAVITHPDQDHYLGFRPLFSHQNVAFHHVYHNGIAERAGDALLGPSDPTGRYLVELAERHEDITRLYRKGSANATRKNYGKLMRAAIENRRVGAIEMLSTRHGSGEGGRTWMPGFAPSDGRPETIEVLGPVPETGTDGTHRLRWFGATIGSTARDEGKTKNGHSILLQVSIGGVKVLLGGDLNQPAEDYLLRHYGSVSAGAPLDATVAPASRRLRSDVLKCCHHGAADVTDEFLRAVDPAVFVVSSGDDESHAHPRPDLLGRLGKNGRGEAPMIMCTEILRSTREKGRADDFLKLRSLDALIDDPGTEDAERAQARKDRRALQDFIQRRNVGVYGAITLRTDGTHIELSFMLERPRGKQRWQRFSVDPG